MHTLPEIMRRPQNSTLFWNYLVTSKQSGTFFQMFVAISESLDFALDTPGEKICLLLRIKQMLLALNEFRLVGLADRGISPTTLQYSKLSIKLPVPLNDLDWIFTKSPYYTTRSISEKIDHTLLFQGCHSQFLGSIKRPGLVIWQTSLLNNNYYLFFKF